MGRRNGHLILNVVERVRPLPGATYTRSTSLSFNSRGSKNSNDNQIATAFSTFLDPSLRLYVRFPETFFLFPPQVQ